MELLTMKRTVVVVVVVWVKVALASVVVMEVMVATGVMAWPALQAQHISDAVKSVSSKALADVHDEGVDA
jgi:hypothetical protein